MTSEVTQFPITGRQRRKNRLGKQVIECFVSGRYLRFRDVGNAGEPEGLAVIVDVMSNNYGEKPDRKICELVLTVDDLRSMVARLEEADGHA